MAEEISLAWGADGAAIDVPEEATHWRVRLLPAGSKKGGNPKVIRRDGVPLLLPITADLALLRDAVGGARGVYRLDPVDEGRTIKNADPAYIQIGDDERDGDEGDDDEPAGGVVRELLKTNRELVNALRAALGHAERSHFSSPRYTSGNFSMVNTTCH